MPKIGDRVPPDHVPASAEELRRLSGRTNRVTRDRARPPKEPTRGTN